ncbi:MAG: Uncharacterized protein G01um10142_366 [Parcubacteria group bacterium Gr01-1014_2]|nr:MAG: Uncharacterized protein G01um10142_366 [Parcubacteria group bacterium Gr01-1014_2]
MAQTLKKYQFSVLTVLAVIIGLLLVVILGFTVYSLFSKNTEETEKIEQATYQAVFLADKQIYFGKLRDIDSPYPVLDDVYYVRLEGEDETLGRLVKLGEGEPHGPKNQMIINRDHILFWENLKDDSQVVQTIRNLKLNQ